jgi:hypothetical protein
MLTINKGYWSFEGLTFDHLNDSSDAIKVSSSATHVVLRQCELRNGQRDGIDGRGEHITIEDCIIHDFWYSGGDAHGIVLNPASGSSPAATGWKIRNNAIYNCSGDCVQLYASSSTPLEDSARDIEISGNILYTIDGQNSENAIDCKGVIDGVFAHNEMSGFTANKAMVIQKGSRNLIVEGNRVHNAHRGMEFRGEDGKYHENLTIRRNIFYGITAEYALKLDQVYNVTIVHNTIASNNAYSLLISEEGIQGGLIANNLIYDSKTPKISGTFSSIDVSHNGWFSTSAGALGSPQDTEGQNPGFVDATGGDFRLAAGSSAIDRGRDVGLPFSGSAPDLGALECESDQLRGDLNLDGMVGISDLQLMVNILLGIDPVKVRADLDGNGVVNTSDLQLEINLILGD